MPGRRRLPVLRAAGRARVGDDYRLSAAVYPRRPGHPDAVTLGHPCSSVRLIDGSGAGTRPIGGRFRGALRLLEHQRRAARPVGMRYWPEVRNASEPLLRTCSQSRPTSTAGCPYWLYRTRPSCLATPRPSSATSPPIPAAGRPNVSLLTALVARATASRSWRSTPSAGAVSLASPADPTSAETAGRIAMAASVVSSSGCVRMRDSARRLRPYRRPPPVLDSGPTALSLVIASGRFPVAGVMRPLVQRPAGRESLECPSRATPLVLL